MHDYYSGFSNDDYLYFNMTRKVIGALWTAILVEKGDDSLILRGAAESVAKQWLDFKQVTNSF